MTEDLTALGALQYASALEYVEDFMRAWRDTMRDPLKRACLTVAYQQAQVDGEDRGGMRCCGTVSEWHRPWCRTGPRHYRAQEVALTRPQMDALKAVGRHRDLSRGQDGITSTAVIRRPSGNGAGRHGQPARARSRAAGLPR